MPPCSPPSRARAWSRLLSPWLWLIACLLVGLSLRLMHYARCPSYWYDEAYLLLNIFHRPCADLLGPLNCHQVAPPLFLWALRGTFLLGGESEWVMRLPAMAAELAALALLFPLARALVDGGRSWIWVVCLCLVSFHALKHGCEVKPYTIDLLLTVVVLLCTATVAREERSPRLRRLGVAGLAGLALCGPWLSFPSVFVLLASSLVLLWGAWQRRDREAWLAWVAFNGLLGLSVLALWHFSMRHLYYSGMVDLWSSPEYAGFPDRSRPFSALLWGLRRPVCIGDYASTGLGVPLTVLSLVGLASLVRQRRGWVVLLLASPIGLALVAAYLGRYPLADRTLFFAAPLVWLAAANGLETIRRQPLSGRWAVVGLALPALLLLPGLARMGKRLFTPVPMMEYREAFAFVRELRQPGDLVWVSHAEVYQVYHGLDAAVLNIHAAADLDRLGRGRRVWLVSSYSPQRRGPYCPEALGRLGQAGSVLVTQRDFSGVQVALYEPASSNR